MTAKKTGKYVCIRDKQLTHHETDIAELKARADFKDVRIIEIKEDIDKIDKKLDKIDNCLFNMERQSERDDFNIDNRVTKLENTLTVLKWIVGVSLTVSGILIAKLGLL